MNDECQTFANCDNLKPTSFPSYLNLVNGKIALRLVQASCGKQLVGTRRAIQDAKLDGNPSEEEIKDCKSLLRATAPNSLTVISFHPGMRSCEDELENLAKTSTVVAVGGHSGNGTNFAYIATGGKLLQKAKLSLSSEDIAFGLRPGSELTVFESGDGMDAPVRWTVFNCHDYTHADLIRVIQDAQLDLIVVVTYNTATRLFWEYAIADMHRLFCYVVLVNVAEFGGSGVFAPFRSIGSEQHANLSLGGQIFGAKGASSLDVTLPLQIGELRRLRVSFGSNDFGGVKMRSAEFGSYQSVMPSERFLATFDRKAGPPEVNSISEHEINWNFCAPRVAVAQLQSMGIAAYQDTRYRIRHHRNSREFEHLLSIRLLELETRCRSLGGSECESPLDLLVLPEVFVPRTYLRTLQGFCDRLGTLVIAGVDYPGSKDAENANECFILRPNEEPITYRKISRSQYDAVNRDGTRMPMQRGTELIRLRRPDGRGIGVLICSDYSNYDLVWALNLEGRQEPLDLIVVLAHNPFSSLYRSCAIADSHRFYQYVIMCNVMTYGGSGIFGPQRTRGSRQVLADVGQGVEAIAMATIPLNELQKARMSKDDDLHAGDFMRRSGVFQSRWLGPMRK